MLFASQSHGTVYTIGQFLAVLLVLNGFRKLGGFMRKPAGKIVGKGLWSIVSSKLK